MGQERLESLLLAAVEKDILIKLKDEALVEYFAAKAE